ncbi:hypothetical protein Pfo_011229 [Paulownia fortunei]|nr:hypothetical protein Pfo_011229 [Paulownia fortunei]
MATFLSLYTSCSLILLLQLLFLTNGVPMDNVCHQTKEPSLCSTVLGSDPRSRKGPLSQLAEIAIDMAEYNAINTKIKIHSLLISAKNPKLETLYAQCENLYLDALAALRAAPDDLKRRRYGDLKVQAVHVREAVDGCEVAFKKKYSPFKRENQAVGILADAVAVIAKKL